MAGPHGLRHARARACCWKCGEAVASAGLVRTGDTDEMPFKLLAFPGSGELLDWAESKPVRVEDVHARREVRAGGGAAVGAGARLSTTARRIRGHVPPAARCGHLEALVWAQEHGCPWDEWMCDDGTASGNGVANVRALIVIQQNRH